MRNPERKSGLEAAAEYLSAEELERRILFEDADLIVVDKPPYLPSTGRSLEDPDCLQFALLRRQGQMVWAVHQLDADTSGLNLFVLRKQLVPIWQRRMRHPNGTKTYLAIVHGRADFDERRIDAAIGVVSEEPTRQLGLRADGQRAVSELRVLSRAANSTLLRVQIETGRTHQIRIHLASIGHSLIGEDWYDARQPRAHTRQALHAWRVDFAAPAAHSGFVCTLAPDLRELASSLGLDHPALEGA